MRRLHGGLLFCVCLFVASSGYASSHREAPLISEDPIADNTDVYAFKAPTTRTPLRSLRTTFPFESPDGGPIFYDFGTDVRYEIHIKNKANTAGDDITYRFTFSKVNEDPTTFFYIRLGKQNQKTTYKCEKSTDGGNTFTTIVMNGVVPPANVGPRSIEDRTVGLGAPSYEALAESAIANASSGEKVFCGPRDDPFFVDLAGAFDVGNFRPEGNPTNPPKDALNRFNVHTIALKIPINLLQKDGKNLSQAANILDPDIVIGVWASAQPADDSDNL
jgi:hypothetical protein